MFTRKTELPETLNRLAMFRFATRCHFVLKTNLSGLYNCMVYIFIHVNTTQLVSFGQTLGFYEISSYDDKRT